MYLAGNSSHSFFMHRLLCFNMHDKIHLRLLIETLIVPKMKDFVPNKCLTLNHNFLLQNNLCHIGTFDNNYVHYDINPRGSKNSKGPKVKQKCLRSFNSVCSNSERNLVKKSHCILLFNCL